MADSNEDWYAVSGNTDLPVGAVRAVALLNRDIAIWRSASGVVQAWHNQCPHRGMRLSFGQVRGEQLSCRYHGWQFEHSGQCTVMPAQPGIKPPSAVCVPTYACRQKLSLIWVNPQAQDNNDLDELLDRLSLENDGLFCKSLFVEAEPADVSGLLLSAIFPPFAAQLGADGTAALEADGAIGSSAEEGCDYTVQWRSSGVGHEAVTARYRSRRLSANLVEIQSTLENGAGEILLIALQSMSANRCGLHLVTNATGDVDQDRKKRLHFACWAQRLRWFLQRPKAEFDGFRPWV